MILEGEEALQDVSLVLQQEEHKAGWWREGEKTGSRQELNFQVTILEHE